MRQDIALKGILPLILCCCCFGFQNTGFCEGWESFKEERLAVKGEVINVHSANLGIEQKSYFVIGVMADATIYADREEKLPPSTIWVVRVSKDKKELFRKYKKGDDIIAYGLRRGKARILDAISPDLGELANKKEKDQ